MSTVSITGQGFEVDATIVAKAFALTPSALQQMMRAGEVTSLCETGIDADAGRFRLTFRYGKRVLRLTVDDRGEVLATSTFDAPRPPQPGG